MANEAANAEAKAARAATNATNTLTVEIDGGKRASSPKVEPRIQDEEIKDPIEHAEQLKNDGNAALKAGNAD